MVLTFCNHSRARVEVKNEWIWTSTPSHDFIMHVSLYNLKEKLAFKYVVKDNAQIVDWVLNAFESL